MLAVFDRKMDRVALSVYIVGVTLVIAAVVGYATLLKVQQKNSVLGKKLAAQLSNAPPAAGLLVSAQLRLPKYFDDDLALVVRDIHQLSQQRGLVVSEAKYSPVQLIGAAEITSMRIESRAKGSYQELKSFLADLLAAHQGLSLDALSIRRSTATDAKVDVQLTFSLYYRKRA